MDVLSLFAVIAIAACVVTGGVCFYIGLSEGRGEADAIAAKVVERLDRRSGWTSIDTLDVRYETGDAAHLTTSDVGS